MVYLHCSKLGLEKIDTQGKKIYRKQSTRKGYTKLHWCNEWGYYKKASLLQHRLLMIQPLKKQGEAHHSIILIDGSKLVDLRHQYNVGVQVKTVYEVKEVDNDFFEGE